MPLKKLSGLLRAIRIFKGLKLILAAMGFASARDILLPKAVPKDE